MPGAGLEPARTLPGPRDFKSINYCYQQQLTSTKTLYQRRFSVGVAFWLLLVILSLVTIVVTVNNLRNLFYSQPTNLESRKSETTPWRAMKREKYKLRWIINPVYCHKQPK